MDAAELLRDPMAAIGAGFPNEAIVIVEAIDPDTGKRSLHVGASEMPSWRLRGMLAEVLAGL